MRRVVQTFVLALSSLYLFALPALATASVDDTEPIGSSGLWDGLMGAAIAGILVGLILFVDAYAGKQPATAQHDHDAH